LSCKYEQVFLAVSAAVAARRAYGCALALYCCAGAVAKKHGNSTIYFWSNSMKFVSVFVLSLVVLTLNDGAFCRDTNSAARNGSFITLKQGDGREFRAFVAGPADAKAAVLVVHDYFGISDATKQSVQRLRS